MTRQEELTYKIAALRSIMAGSGLDGIYLKRQDDFAWLSCGGRNYVGVGDMGNCGLLVTAEKCYAVSNNIERPRMIDENSLEDMGFEYHSFVWHDGAQEGKILSSLVPSGKIGYDYGGQNNVLNEVKAVRMDLTEAEIERYKAIGRDASEAIESAAQQIRKGMSEYEIAARIIGNMEERGLEELSCMVAADERIFKYRHPLPTSKAVAGRVQMGGNFRRDGLVVCLTRYASFGQLSPELETQMKANQLIDCTLIAASEPGTVLRDALLKGRAKYEELGYGDEFNKHHQGGPIGYAGRDYRVDFNVTDTVKAHQGFCWNPSITGTKSEDTFVCEKGRRTAITGPVLFDAVAVEADGFLFERPATLIL